MTPVRPPAARPGCTRPGVHGRHRLCQETVHCRARGPARQVSVLERERVLGEGYDGNNVLATLRKHAASTERGRVPPTGTRGQRSLPGHTPRSGLPGNDSSSSHFIYRGTTGRGVGQRAWALGCQSQGPRPMVTPPGTLSVRVEEPKGGFHVLSSLLTPGLGKGL